MGGKGGKGGKGELAGKGREGQESKEKIRRLTFSLGAAPQGGSADICPYTSRGDFWVRLDAVQRPSAPPVAAASRDPVAPSVPQGRGRRDPAESAPLDFQIWRNVPCTVQLVCDNSRAHVSGKTSVRTMPSWSSFFRRLG